MKNLKHKIESISAVAPKVNDFLNKGFDQDYAKEISAQYEVSYTENSSDLSYESIEDEFFKCVDFHKFSVFGFNFSPVEEYQEFYKIGSVDTDFIILRKDTKQIALLDYFHLKTLTLIAPNISTFLELLPFMVKYDSVGFLGDQYTSEVKSTFLNNIAEVLDHNTVYTEYFTDRIPA